MTYRLVYTEEAARKIQGLDKSIRDRVAKAVGRLRENPELGKRLTGLLSDRFSYRVGDWRILYKIRRHELLVLILTVGHRRDVYD